MRTTTGLALSSKETPQSVSVVTKRQISHHYGECIAHYHQHQSLIPDPTGLPMGNGYDLKLPWRTYLGAPWNKRVDHKANLFAEWEHRFSDSWEYVGKVNYLNTHSSNKFAYITNTRGTFPGVDSTGLAAGATENIQLYDNRGYQFTFIML